MSALRNHVIRLAHQNPVLRPHLLPILASTSREASKGKKFNRADAGDVLDLPAVLSGKKDVEKWESLIRMKMYDYDADSDDRKEYLAEARKQVGYGAWLHRNSATGKHLKELEKRLNSPDLMKSEMD